MKEEEIKERLVIALLQRALLGKWLVGEAKVSPVRRNPGQGNRSIFQSTPVTQ